MANGDDVWKAIDKLRDDHTNLARDGCGHKEWHERTSNELRQDLISEIKARGAMGDKIFGKLDNLMLMVVGALGGIVVILLKSYLPMIFGK
ncbi:MAG: hypothetical protein WCV62_05990 [Candidatus Peribacteraceae bacterium]|jgi:hypothetical protein